MKKFLSYIMAFLFIFYGLIVSTGCSKEYSNEASPLQGIPIGSDTTRSRDTAHAAAVYPYCNTCSYINTAADSTWSFKIDTAVLCGNVTDGVISPDGKGMTFFGPSACSQNYGLIITAFFTNPVFAMDQNHLVATNVTLQYYDQTGTSDILKSKRPHILSLIIDTYSNDTKMATGTFTGSVINKAGDIISIDAGRFSVQF